MDPTQYYLWLAGFDPQAYAAANFDTSAFGAFLQNPPTDPALTADVIKAKAVAVNNGNTGLANTLDFILKYGDKALTILTKNGIIKNQNLIGAGYSFGYDPTAADTSISKAPLATSRVFNIDFTDPKVLIICFLLVTILFYFLFFNSKKTDKK